MTGIEWVSLSSIILIAIAVCAMFAIHAPRSTLREDRLDLFVATSAAILFGWIWLAGVLAAAGVFQAAASKAFPVPGSESAWRWQRAASCWRDRRR